MQKSCHLQKTRIGDDSMSADPHISGQSFTGSGTQRKLLPLKGADFPSKPTKHLSREPLHTPSQLVSLNSLMDGISDKSFYSY